MTKADGQTPKGKQWHQAFISYIDGGMDGAYQYCCCTNGKHIGRDGELLKLSVLNNLEAEKEAWKEESEVIARYADRDRQRAAEAQAALAKAEQRAADALALLNDLRMLTPGQWASAYHGFRRDYDALQPVEGS